MKRLAAAVVAAVCLVGPVGLAEAQAPAPVEVAQEAPAARVMPTWTRTCGFANCSVYFNKRETRIAAYGGALLTQLLCAILNGTPAKLACTGIAWLVGRAGDSAIGAGKCVKLSFSRWTGVIYWVGTYGPSWRCV